MDVAAINETSRIIVDSAMKVHSALGPGLLESAYTVCLAFELRQRGCTVATEVPIPVVYESVRLRVAYRADMLVNSCVLVENKGVVRLAPIHRSQLLSYLKLTGLRLGLLINFHAEHLKDGIKRVANGM